MALVSGGGVYLWQQNEIKQLQNNLQNQIGFINNQETPTAIPTYTRPIPTTVSSSPSDSPSANWITYQNKRDGYEIKLPVKWLSDENMAVEGALYKESELYLSPNGQRGPVSEAFRIRYYPTATDYIKPEQSLLDFLTKNAEPDSVKKIKIGSVDAYSACFGAVGGCDNQEILQVTKGIYIFSSNGDLSDLVKQIILTFKII